MCPPHPNQVARISSGSSSFVTIIIARLHSGPQRNGVVGHRFINLTVRRRQRRLNFHPSRQAARFRFQEELVRPLNVRVCLNLANRVDATPIQVRQHSKIADSRDQR
jgi:hypothetical protein